MLDINWRSVSICSPQCTSPFIPSLFRYKQASECRGRVYNSTRSLSSPPRTMAPSRSGTFGRVIFLRNLVALDSGGSGGVVWRIRCSNTKLVCAVGSRNGTEETKLLVLDFDVDDSDGNNSTVKGNGGGMIRELIENWSWILSIQGRAVGYGIRPSVVVVFVVNLYSLEISAGVGACGLLAHWW